MLRNDSDVVREFVFENNDEENLLMLAKNGNVDELASYLLQMSKDKVREFFNNAQKVDQFLQCFPSKKIAKNFTTVVLGSKNLMPLVPVDFYQRVSLLPKKTYTSGLFSPQLGRKSRSADLRVSRSYSPGK